MIVSVINRLLVSYVELDLSSNLEAPLIIDDVGPVQSHRQAGQILLQHVGVLHQN